MTVSGHHVDEQRGGAGEQAVARQQHEREAPPTAIASGSCTSGSVKAPR